MPQARCGDQGGVRAAPRHTTTIQTHTHTHTIAIQTRDYYTDTQLLYTWANYKEGDDVVRVDNSYEQSTLNL